MLAFTIVWNIDLLFKPGISANALPLNRQMPLHVAATIAGYPVVSFVFLANVNLAACWTNLLH